MQRKATIRPTDLRLPMFLFFFPVLLSHLDFVDAYVDVNVYALWVLIVIHWIWNA
ncbi:hypothetical protein BJX63DRAFT_383850 [Aspergillus granulosus]|uniref:Uncharacterized protein n=1 Tax=Aspergillus granulosus TaxID=176169 RepID=A0ABR4HS01_9EURO